MCYRKNVWTATKISCSGAAAIVGISWGKMHIRLMGLAVAPFGKMVARQRPAALLQGLLQPLPDPLAELPGQPHEHDEERQQHNDSNSREGGLAPHVGHHLLVAVDVASDKPHVAAIGAEEKVDHVAGHKGQQAQNDVGEHVERDGERERHRPHHPQAVVDGRQREQARQRVAPPPGQEQTQQRVDKVAVHPLLRPLHEAVERMAEQVFLVVAHKKRSHIVTLVYNYSSYNIRATVAAHPRGCMQPARRRRLWCFMRHMGVEY